MSLRDFRIPVSIRQSDQIWRLADELRANGRAVDLSSLITEAEKRGIPIGWRDVRSLPQLVSGHVVDPPDYVPEFLASYFRDRHIRRALDPSVGTGTLLTALAESGIVPNGIGVARSLGALALAQSISRGQPLEWQLGDPMSALRELDPGFDLIISAPGLGSPDQTRVIDSSLGPVEIRDSSSNLLVLLASQLLSEEGEAAFLLSEGFFKPRPRGVMTALPKFGLHVQGVIALPREALAPWTSVPANLVFVNRRKTLRLFSAPLLPDADPSVMIENFRRRQPGNVPEHGRLVESSSFHSWRAVVLDEEIHRLARTTGTAAVQLADIMDSLRMGSASKGGQFQDSPNSVYLPLIGNTAAVTSLADLSVKPENAAQIVLRPELAVADYVARFLNTAVGRRIRERLALGPFIPRITRQALLGATVFLPPMEVQKEVVTTHRSIRELISQLEEYDRKLGERPREFDQIRKTVLTFRREEDADSWIEALPFPLASVLRHYYSDNQLSAKLDYLLHFYEGLAQFNFCVMISAFRSNRQFYDENRHRWIDKKVETNPFERSDFGCWRIVGERLAKITRSMLSGTKDDRITCLDLYKVTSAESLSPLIGKEMYEIFEAVNKHRNDWKGHGGAASDAERARRLELLENALARVRHNFANSSSEWLLVRPQYCTIKSGVFDFSAELLMGSHPTFRKVQVQTLAGMEHDKLHLLDENSRRPLELVPLFRMMSSPKTAQNACYFYNRIDGENLRWVSYHFAEDAEIHEPNSSVAEVIHELGGGT